MPGPIIAGGIMPAGVPGQEWQRSATAMQAQQPPSQPRCTGAGAGHAVPAGLQRRGVPAAHLGGPSLAEHRGRGTSSWAHRRACPGTSAEQAAGHAKF